MIAAVLASCLAFLAGLAVMVWIERRRAPLRPQIPKVWPLVARPLVNSKERKVWKWLARVMHDQQIMIKLPVTRFTSPAQREGADHWYNLLNRVYCTFTVCGLDGKVIGCVDVPGVGGLSMSNQTLKYSLLSQCGIPYWVVEPDNLPHMNQIRSAFLGELAARHDETERLDSRLRDVADHLQAVVLRQRISKFHNGQGFEPTTPNEDSILSEGWEQNSFMGALDSRAGGLQRH